MPVKKNELMALRLVDKLEVKREIEVVRGYGGLLFVGYFCLSKKDARRLARHILRTIPAQRRTP